MILGEVLKYLRGFSVVIHKVKEHPQHRQICLTMLSCVLLWHHDCLRQVTIKIVLVGLLVTIFQVPCVKFSIEKGLI
jgi:hypothetical protein